METIIAGRFDEQLLADKAVAALEARGFPSDRIATMFVNPPGRHDLHGTRRDPDASAGAHHAGAGAASGAAKGSGVGAIVGIATVPVLGPIAALAGAGIGAYIGSLTGALDETGKAGADGATPARAADEALPRKSGVFVAVSAASATDEASAIAALQGEGAMDVERAQGTIAEREWTSFDPLSTPALV